MPRPFFAHLARRYEPPSALDRRQFLKLTLAASAGLLISGSGGFAKRPRRRRGSQQVIIIGGGLSGLACAYEPWQPRAGKRRRVGKVLDRERRLPLPGRQPTFGSPVCPCPRYAPPFRNAGDPHRGKG